jgi:hypothetical protein
VRSFLICAEFGDCVLGYFVLNSSGMMRENENADLWTKRFTSIRKQRRWRAPRLYVATKTEPDAPSHRAQTINRPQKRGRTTSQYRDRRTTSHAPMMYRHHHNKSCSCTLQPTRDRSALSYHSSVARRHGVASWCFRHRVDSTFHLHDRWVALFVSQHVDVFSAPLKSVPRPLKRLRVIYIEF